MFDLSDSRAKRARVITGYAEIDVGLGVILAAVDFEWTCRRCILSLSTTPTVTLREKFSNEYASFFGLSKGWKAELAGHQGLDIIFSTEEVSWSQVGDAMTIRNHVVHGSGDQVDCFEGRYAIYILEKACDILTDYAKNWHKDIFKRISRPRSKEERLLESKNSLQKVNLTERVSGASHKLGADHWVNLRTPW